MRFVRNFSYAWVVDDVVKAIELNLHPHNDASWSGQRRTASHLIINGGFSNLSLRFSAKSSSDACIAFDNGIDDNFITCKESSIKVAVVWEPAAINAYGHARVREWADNLDLVLTHDERLITELGTKARFLAVGGSYLWNRELLIAREKTKLVSISASKKNFLPGHSLRHEAITLFQSHGLEVFGSGYRKYRSPNTPHRRFLFSVVIENVQETGFFTEKLVHSLLYRTVPIYWGATLLPEGFDESGIIRFENLNQLGEILRLIDRKVYDSMMPAIVVNQAAALEYASSELNVQRVIADYLGKPDLAFASAGDFFLDSDAVLSGKSRFSPLARAPRFHKRPRIWA